LNSSTRIILRDLGRVLHVPGLMALASLPICYLFQEYYAIWPFVWTALIALAVGQLLYRVFQCSDEAYLDQAMVIAALSWVCVSLLGALPFLLIAANLTEQPQVSQTVQAFRQPWNALFESFSGFTATGLTVALDPSALPRSLQWWRSFTEWIGGAGIIVLILSVVGSTSGIFRLYFSEARTDRLAPSVSSTVRTIWWIYLLFTILGVLLLRLTGVPWWEALNHGMTGIATGGFDITGTSVARYDERSRAVVILVMILGAISFSVHYQVLVRRHIPKLWRDAQQRVFWVFLLLGPLVLALENFWFERAFLWSDSAFQWVSALTTAGFSTTDERAWSTTTQLLLSLAMIIGGAAGSTASGIKLNRVMYLYKGMVWRIQRILLPPHQLLRYQVGDGSLSEEDANNQVESAGVLVILWLAMLGLGVFIMLHMLPEQFPLSEVVFEMASAQSNVGLSVGITGPDLHWAGKLVLILFMYMGRLEIVPVFILGFALLRRMGIMAQPTSR